MSPLRDGDCRGTYVYFTLSDRPTGVNKSTGMDNGKWVGWDVFVVAVPPQKHPKTINPV
jgi:hypothetical protein